MSETQKIIMKQTGVSQSQYLQNIASLHSHIDTTNEGIKNASYERYLNRKKGKVLSNQGKTIAQTALSGNKTQSLSLTNKNTSDCSLRVCN
tara:strand:- start:4703 stop:4975 length:273 start_codon:yes stop_codon:yes gene_type:complete